MKVNERKRERERARERERERERKKFFWLKSDYGLFMHDDRLLSRYAHH